jgi:hypothetical protein
MSAVALAQANQAAQSSFLTYARKLTKVTKLASAPLSIEWRSQTVYGDEWLYRSTSHAVGYGFL